MDLEEAGEEVLRGRPYVECGFCHGTGTRKIPRNPPADESGIEPLLDLVEVNCHLCFNRGYVPRYEFHEAARLLGVRIPPMPRRKSADRRRSW